MNKAQQARLDKIDALVARVAAANDPITTEIVMRLLTFPAAAQTVQSFNLAVESIERSIRSIEEFRQSHRSTGRGAA